MWTRRQCATILALAAVFTVVALLLFPPVSTPATLKPTAAETSLYIRGWLDRAVPAGVYTQAVACKPATAGGYQCVGDTTDGHRHVCVRARIVGFRLATAFAVVACRKGLAE